MPGWGEQYEVRIASEPPARRRMSHPVYQTALGAMYCGHAERVLKTQPLRRSLGKAQLIFTSPPFPLKTQKRYGNLEGEPPHISFALEVGNAWEAGRPVMSTVVLRALLRFLEWGGLNLCQEFIWYNNARLPARRNGLMSSASG
jgi:hypothetical protein